MGFDIGSVFDQAQQVNSSFRDGTSSIFDDAMIIANAEAFGGLVSSGLTIGLTLGSKTITQAAASKANVGKMLVISGSTANDGTYLIVGAVANTSYDLADSNMANFNAANTQSGAWGSISDFPTLSSDLNYLRTKSKQLNNPAGNWFDPNPTFADPDNLGSPITVNLEHLKDAHTKKTLRAIPTAAINVTVSATNTEVAIPDTTAYVDSGRDTGLPVSDAGKPDAANYNITLVGIYNTVTKEPVTTQTGANIFGRLASGTAGVNVKVKFFTGPNTAAAASFAWTASEPSGVDFIYYKVNTLYGSTRDEMLGLTKGRFLSLAGDSEQVDDIRDLQEFAGSGDNITTPVLTNTTGFYPFGVNNVNGPVNPADTDLEELLNVLNNEIGNLDFTADQETITGGDGATLTVTAMLANIAQAVFDAAGVEKFSARYSGAAIPPGTPIDLTVAGLFGVSFAYTPAVGTIGAGHNLDLYLNGVLVTAHRTDYDNDYQETSGTSITFKFKTVKANDRLVAIVRS